MKVLILGASGYLGARIFADLHTQFEVVGTYHNTPLFDDLLQLDITQKHQVQDLFHRLKPDVVIHTANYASARLAENNLENFEKLNFSSTEAVKDVANEIGAKLIFISSFAALTPDNIYGQLKLESEKIAQLTQAGYLVLRPSLILGLSPNTQNDRPFNRVLNCLRSSGPHEFDTSWKFLPTYIGHISAVISTAIHKEIWNKTVHVFSPSVATQYSVAQDILMPFGIAVKPSDKKKSIPLQEISEDELLQLGLPTCSYQEMIEQIHREMSYS